MRSMTGYGEASEANENHRVSVTARSVNARFLDFSLRLKEEFRRLEVLVRRATEERFERGRIDITVVVEPTSPHEATVEIQTEVVRALFEATAELKSQGLIGSELGVGDLLRLPDVVAVREAEDILDETGSALLVRVVEEALDQVVSSRMREGTQLEAILTDRIRVLRQTTVALTARVEEVRAQLHEKLRQRLTDLLGDTRLDEERVVQEAAILVDKADVSEELDRLGAHLDHFAEVMVGSGGCGKRLDFLTQEVLRELNTLGAKGRDAEITRLVLDGKVVCEQLREQLQNVE